MYDRSRLTDLLPSADCKGVAKPKPYTLAAMIAWLRSQNPTQEYDPGDDRSCLMCRFTDAQWERACRLLNRRSGNLDQWAVISYGDNNKGPFNMSAALDRALRLQSSGGV